MSVKNPNILSFQAHAEALETAGKNPEKYLDLFAKITQAESQKRKYLEKAIVVLDENRRLNTSKIIQKTGLSPKSVCGTLRIFREKKIVKVHMLRDRQNNEKIYTLNRVRAILYLGQLSIGKSSKILRESEKRARELSLAIRGRPYAFPTLEYRDRFVTDEIRNKKIILPRKYRDEAGTKNKRIMLIDLPISVFDEIVMKYHTGRYCVSCWEKDELSELEVSHDVRYCVTCGERPDNQINNTVWYKNELGLWKDKKHRYNFDKSLPKKLNPASAMTNRR
jgi:DNA-binding transcriptional ArsR family regulator